jgi:hypothetical protein
MSFVSPSLQKPRLEYGRRAYSDHRMKDFFQKNPSRAENVNKHRKEPYKVKE